MDAVEFLITRDRMCGSFNGRCNGCEVKERTGVDVACIYYMAKHPQEFVEIVERWGREHSMKTRQSEFLRLFPNARTGTDGITMFCPGGVDSRFVCPGKSWDCHDPHCADCRKEFWLAEIEDDEAATE